jgi:copper chaperone
MTKFNVPEMSCGHCTSTIEKSIKGADQKAQVSCDVGERTVAVESSLGTDALLAVIKEAGYEATAA